MDEGMQGNEPGDGKPGASGDGFRGHSGPPSPRRLQTCQGVNGTSRWLDGSEGEWEFRLSGWARGAKRTLGWRVEARGKEDSAVFEWAGEKWAFAMAG